jgi:hypothetical protein
MFSSIWTRTADPSTPQWRPLLHITTEDTWINDPNGLLVHNGTYHAFFQTNPRGNFPANMSWGHVTSQDLITWHHQPIALECTAEEEAWSGSAVADVCNTSGFSPDERVALVAIYTAAYTKASKRAGTQVCACVCAYECVCASVCVHVYVFERAFSFFLESEKRHRIFLSEAAASKSKQKLKRRCSLNRGFWFQLKRQVLYFRISSSF